MFSKIILEIKEKHNISYATICETAGLPKTDRTTLINFVAGKRTFPVHKLEKIFQTYNVEFIIK